MKACEGRIGRAFVIRLEHGDMVPACIERFAEENSISVGHVILVGGMGGGKIVAGPKRSEERPPQPVLVPIDNAYETAGVGILAPDKNGKPVLHMHGTFGRSGKVLTGCMRPGVITWLIGEVIIYEIIGTDAARIMDSESGFELLELGHS